MRLAHLFQRATLALALSAATSVGMGMYPAAALAHPGHGGATQNPELLSALISLGGGPTAFNAKSLRQNLGGSAEEGKLAKSLGAASVLRFDDVFTFVVNDAIKSMNQAGATLPPPAVGSKKEIAAALYRAGLVDGKFDVERLFDTLFSANVHMHAMMGVAQKYGAPGENAYHQVFGRLVADVGGNGAPIDADADSMHHHDMKNMDMKGMDMKNMDMKGMSTPAPSPAATATPGLQ